MFDYVLEDEIVDAGLETGPESVEAGVFRRDRGHEHGAGGLVRAAPGCQQKT
jgi:hypothetical protein